MKPEDLSPAAVARARERTFTRNLNADIPPGEARERVGALQKEGGRVIGLAIERRTEGLRQRGIHKATPPADTTGVVVLERRQDEHGEFAVVTEARLVRKAPTRMRGRRPKPGDVIGVEVKTGVMQASQPDGYDPVEHRSPFWGMEQAFDGRSGFVEWLHMESTVGTLVRRLTGQEPIIDDERLRRWIGVEPAAPEHWAGRGAQMLGSMEESLREIEAAINNPDLNPLTPPARTGRSRN